ncbi:MAG: hypothetical protein HJJLKODD_01229 [Phycisphaerae bacterium]|nr:hypothetical protein [Phycisphaerae bacterium]
MNPVIELEVESAPVASRLNWPRRLQVVTDMMREMSLQTDPQAMVRTYSERVHRLVPSDRLVTVSRRGLSYPQYRITRSSLWTEAINPWKEPHRLPLLSGGLLAEMIYSNEPRIIDHLELAEDDPGLEYLAGQRSLIAMPLFDQGESLNMVVLTREREAAFDREQFPEMVWMSGLFGRATHNLVLNGEIKQAYNELDRELKVVAEIQRSLLPVELPKVPRLQLASYYQASARAGGDYYDFFPLPDGRWGILLADVSGHGTPAAVVMAILHSIVHNYGGSDLHPEQLIQFVNERLYRHFTARYPSFATAFYGIFCPKTLTLEYSLAGHHPPRLKRCSDGRLLLLDQAEGFPLGVEPDGEFTRGQMTLTPGDQVIFYTDGITEAMNPAGEMFGVERLDVALENCHLTADGLIRKVVEDVQLFTQGRTLQDDCTLLVSIVTDA